MINIEEGESNLMQMGVRMYSPQLGRFLSVDPLHELMPRHNPYHYAFNSPLVWKDPSGLAPEKEKHSERLLGDQLPTSQVDPSSYQYSIPPKTENDYVYIGIPFYATAEYDAGFYTYGLWPTYLPSIGYGGGGGGVGSGRSSRSTQANGPRTQGDKSLGQVGVLSKGQANFAIFNLGILVSSAKYNKSNIENNYNHHDDQKVMIFNKYKYMTQRPDKDKYITSNEAIWWSIFGKDNVSKYGGSMNLQADINKVDLSRVTSLDFDNTINNKALINLYSPKYFSSYEDAQVYGSIRLKYTGIGEVRAYWDTYDTDIHLKDWSWLTEAPRNTTTLGLRALLYLNSLSLGGGGTFNSFNIEIIGTAKIKVIKNKPIYLNPLAD